MGDDACLVCGRAGAIPVVSICGDCIGFATEAFEFSAEAIKEGRVPLESIDWSNMVSSALRIATRGDEIDEQTDQVLEIVENATGIAESIWTVSEEIRTALDGGDADPDRIADAINDGVTVLYGNDGAGRIIQAGIRITLDLLSGDSPQDVLRGLLKELLPGWMLTDLWLDQLFEPPEPPKPVIPEHDFMPVNHRWQTAEGVFTCEECEIEVGPGELVAAMESPCPGGDPDRCAVCGEPKKGHPGQLDEALSARLDALAREHLAAFDRAVTGDADGAEGAITEARETYFGRLAEALDGAADSDASTWLRKAAQGSFRNTVEQMRELLESGRKSGEEAERAWIDRSMPKVTQPYTDMMPAGLDPMDLAFVEQITPGDPAILYSIVHHVPDHPISVDYAETVGGHRERDELRRTGLAGVRAFGETATEFAEKRGGAVFVG